MLYCEKMDISEGFDPTKNNSIKECMVCHCWIFNHGFIFRDSVCNGCDDLKMLSINVSDIAIITVKDVDYCYVIYDINKSKAINLLEKSMLEDRGYI